MRFGGFKPKHFWIAGITAGFLLLGVLVALPTDSPVVDGCLSLPDVGGKFACYQQSLTDVQNSQGASAALTKLDSLQKSSPYVRDHCHPLVHVLGAAAYSKYHDVDTAVQYETGICYTGYTHGIMESYMSSFSDSQLLSAMPTICHDTARTLKFYNCVHGIGHGVTIRFDGDIYKALPYCDLLTDDWQKNGCYNGVFMQNIVVDGQDHVSKYLKADDLLYPCNVVDTPKQDACYLIQGRHVLAATHQDISASFGWCDRAGAYIPTCYQSLGTDLSSYAAGNVATLVSLCAQGNPSYQGYCYGAAAGDAVYRRQRPSDADPLCAAVASTYQEQCRLGQRAAAGLL